MQRSQQRNPKRCALLLFTIRAGALRSKPSLFAWIGHFRSRLRNLSLHLVTIDHICNPLHKKVRKLSRETTSDDMYAGPLMPFMFDASAPVLTERDCGLFRLPTYHTKIGKAENSP